MQVSNEVGLQNEDIPPPSQTKGCGGRGEGGMEITEYDSEYELV